MIKRTIAIENPCRLSVRNDQLIIRRKEAIDASVPIEDIGVLVVDNPGVTYSNACMIKLLENNTAVIISDSTHHPAGLLLPLDVNSVQSERFNHQILASATLKKQLWQQTVKAKIKNQAALLGKIGIKEERLNELAKRVKSGDSGNLEAQAARYYWPKLFGKAFRRNRFGDPPNNLLNYGYMILRAAVARSLVSSGLLPTVGIHHHNRYNAYCLADDIMEPYRIFVDNAVLEASKNGDGDFILKGALKQRLLSVLAEDVRFGDTVSPLLVGLHRTTASLQCCFEGKAKTIEYPKHL